METRINIKLGEDLLLSLDGAPIAVLDLDDLNCVTAIFLATYKLMYSNKVSQDLNNIARHSICPTVHGSRTRSHPQC